MIRKEFNPLTAEQVASQIDKTVKELIKEIYVPEIQNLVELAVYEAAHKLYQNPTVISTIRLAAKEYLMDQFEITITKKGE